MNFEQNGSCYQKILAKNVITQILQSLYNFISTLAMVEGDLQRAEERAEAGESKIVDLEEELRVIGENLKALEVAEEKAQQREEEYKRQIKNLSERLKTAEAR